MTATPHPIVDEKDLKEGQAIMYLSTIPILERMLRLHQGYIVALDNFSDDTPEGPHIAYVRVKPVPFAGTSGKNIYVFVDGVIHRAAMMTTQYQFMEGGGTSWTKIMKEYRKMILEKSNLTAKRN